MVGVGPRDPVWALGGAYTPPRSAAGHNFFDVLGEETGGRPLDGAALTVALDVVQAWAVLITVGFTLVLFLFLAFCVCARKDEGYDDYDLTQGITTVKVCHDGGENGLGSYPRLNGSNILKGSDDASQASSRCTLKRELPAIPLSAHPDPAGTECNVERTQSQHSSDLYAAVGDLEGGNGLGKVIGGVQVLPAGAIGPDGRAAIIRDPALTSPTEPTPPAPHPEAIGGEGAASHPYAKVKKNHPYAHVKLPKKDHPYAKVQIRDGSDDPETDTDNYDDPKAITKEKSPRWSSEGGYEPAPPVPEKRFDLEEEKTQGAAAPDHMMSTSVTSASSEKGPASPRSPHLSARPAAASGSTPSPTSPAPIQSPATEIQAALAISGRTPANEEMPYMTPPLHHQTEEAGIDISSQQNFSGDSQDSRGYTSISVREPLAAIKAQTQAAAAGAPQTGGGQPGEGEGYYMTVSDDSADEMYACIYEGNRGVGSETYAQIQPRSTPPPPPPPMPSPPHAPSTPSPLSTRGESQPPPAPPSVDSLRHVVHSRQASSSSAASTVMGSPGAEKRGTRSPLPPLPQGDTSMYSGHSPQPPHSPPRTAAPAERPTQRALEEMYAKVMKKQRPGHTRGDSCGGGVGGGGESDAGSVSSSRRGSVDVGGVNPTTPRQSVDLGAMTRSLVETRNHEVVSSISRAKSYEKAGVWSTTAQHSQPSLPKPNYETIPQMPPTSFYTGSDPGYETVKNTEPAYASVERQEESYPGYETVKTSDMESEPGYETLKHREYEPGYETVTGETKQAPSEPGYETVAHENIREDDEPGYETVTHPRTDSGYEMVKGKPGSGFGDPGYEELKGAAHHPRTISENDPNYEQLKFTSRRSSEGESEPGYEVVKKAQETESTYEFMRDYDTQHFPPYEKIAQPDVVPAEQAAPPVYATVQKGLDKKPKSPEEPTTTQPSDVLGGSMDSFPQLSTGGTEVLMRIGSKEGKDMTLPLAKVEEQQEPFERRSPEGKSPKASPPGMKSPKGSPTSSVKSHKGSPSTRSPRDSPTSKKSPRGSPPSVKSPKSPSSPKPMVSSSPPRIKSPPLPAKSPEGSPKEARSPVTSPPPCKSPISSPKEAKSSSPPSKSPICSPRQAKGPVSFHSLAKSPVGSLAERDLMAASGLDERSGEESPPMMRSPSPDIDVPVGKKSPVASPAAQSSVKESPLSERGPMAASVVDESSGKESPPMMRSPSPDVDVPLARKSPVKESPPMMKSPSPDMNLPPPQKSPPGSPPQEGKALPPMMKSPSPDMDLPPPQKSPPGSPPQEGRALPPMMKSPSPDMDLPPPLRKSPASSPPAPSEEIPPVTQSPGLDFPPPASIPSPPRSPGKETPSLTRSPSPDSEAASPVKASPKVPSPPAQIPAVVAAAAAAAAMSSDSSSLSETGSPTMFIPPPPPPLAATGAEDDDTDKPGIAAETEPTQEPFQNADVITNLRGSEGVQFSSLIRETVEDSTPAVTDEAETLPVQPEVVGSEREGSPVAFSSLGSEDLPAPLIAYDIQNQPQETVNPLYLLDEVNDDGLEHVPYSMQDAGPPPPPPSGPSSLCGELPPPPPMVMDMDDAVFTNDLPPPLPESSHFMQRTSTLCDDTPPPPLVPPSDVEGLDEMLNLANMGSSSSGSTAGQPGSLHGNSEKDSDSPQEPSVMLMEASVAGEELPPPPPLPEPPEPLEAKAEKDSDSEVDNSISSGYEGGFTAGGVTVTVNPMSDVEESSESPVSALPPPPPPPTSSEPPHVAPPSPIAATATGANSAGSQSSSSGSGSQDTGSGSVESVVTVECVPPPDIPGPTAQQASDSSSSPENHSLEQHEQITPV